jgi:hypothetical protein
MEESPWKAISHSASEGIPLLLWNPYSHEPITGPYYEPATSFPKTHSNIILPSTRSSSEWSLPSRRAPVLNYAPRHEGVLGSGGIASLILWPRH